ncbi:dynein intermediate chain 3, ciliary [Mycetomoellerius zeteki]|uniref:dynein intermediate chain 3, ciliary n=1 Tax=Mycetomoellerius zeteki TaxID=64791 RepID=UPI00084E523E|nr:PREDICTED: dynein intermediate chain 3, ciliary-like [Trachymyrmex zeteki]
MLIQYAYIKPRSQFGKQCFFGETDSIVQENILPDPKLMRNYIYMSHCHRGVQMSKQFALHEMQTASKVTKESGMLHLEGGWPKEINVKDDETVLRFRRRVVKNEYWAPKMKTLTDPMERCILQNNVINIYKYYFDDIEPTALVLSYDIRTSNMYADPQPIVRPINHLSWSPGAQNRLAAAYSFMEFERKLSNVNPSSYIWDIENPNKPVICLKSSSPLLIVEFNPRDPSMLISGLMSGQVCNWDIRIGARPVQMSHRQFSHRNPANQTLWIQSKTNKEFFSASTDGAIKWWDIRKMRQPTDELVMDLDDPLRADILRAIGVTKLQYEPSIGYRFLAGMENGMVINIRRKVMKPVDKLAMRFNCHVGPVIAIDRSPFSTKNFLTVGDWTVKIWSDDIREDCLITIREQNADLRGGCWSRSRYSVFFTINATGLLEVYDILNGVDSPVTTFRVCNDSLTTIAPHENGQLLAVGSHDGNIYLVECSNGHITNTKTDKANLIAYLERCSRFEKIVDARLKEMRLMQANIHENSAMDRSAFISKKKGNNQEKNKNNVLIKGKGEHPKKKSRMKRLEKDDTFFKELADSEAAFFQTVKKEFASYPRLDPETEQMISLMQETPRKRKILRESAKVEEKISNTAWLLKSRERIRTGKSISLTRSLIEEIEVDKEEVKEKAIAKIEAPFIKPIKIVKKRRGQILSKVCAVEVCKPEICCADLEEKRKAELQIQLASEEEKSSWVITQRRPKLFDFEQKLPEHSSIEKRRILLEEGESLANVLADEVEEARREMRAWQERIALGKRDSWRPRTIEVIHEKPEGKKKEVGNGDVESPVRNVEEGRMDFRQLAETSSKWKSAIGDKTLQARGKREATKLDSHLEKCAQEEETYPTLSAYTDESTETVTTESTKRSRGSDQ